MLFARGGEHTGISGGPEVRTLFFQPEAQVEVVTRSGRATKSGAVAPQQVPLLGSL